MFGNFLKVNFMQLFTILIRKLMSFGKTKLISIQLTSNITGIKIIFGKWEIPVRAVPAQKSILIEVKNFVI